MNIGRLKWADHVVRMEGSRPAERALLSNQVGRRLRGRPNPRWDGCD